jgi:hypothetical protein
LWSHTILKGRTIGTKDEQLEQLEYGEDFCCCRSMIHICSLVDKVNSRVQRGSCCRTSVSKAFHKKPAEALLAGEAYYAFKKKKIRIKCFLTLLLKFLRLTLLLTYILQGRRAFFCWKINNQSQNLVLLPTLSFSFGIV